MDKLKVSTAINVFSNSFYTADFIRTFENNVKKCKFSLDDFGKGYSNLQILKQLPFHEVKLDRLLVNRAMSCQKTRENMKVLKSIAIDSGIERIVYEGIENQGMENMILDFDSTAILQGYFYAMPRPISDLYDN